jgi:hypothetical protein
VRPNSFKTIHIIPQHLFQSCHFYLITIVDLTFLEVSEENPCLDAGAFTNVSGTSFDRKLHCIPWSTTIGFSSEFRTWLVT